MEHLRSSTVMPVAPSSGSFRRLPRRPAARPGPCPSRQSPLCLRKYRFLVPGKARPMPFSHSQHTMRPPRFLPLFATRQNFPPPSSCHLPHPPPPTAYFLPFAPSAAYFLPSAFPAARFLPSALPAARCILRSVSHRPRHLPFCSLPLTPPVSPPLPPSLTLYTPCPKLPDALRVRTPPTTSCPLSSHAFCKRPFSALPILPCLFSRERTFSRARSLLTPREAGRIGFARAIRIPIPIRIGFGFGF